MSIIINQLHGAGTRHFSRFHCVDFKFHRASSTLDCLAVSITIAIINIIGDNKYVCLLLLLLLCTESTLDAITPHQNDHLGAASKTRTTDACRHKKTFIHFIYGKVKVFFSFALQRCCWFFIVFFYFC